MLLVIIMLNAVFRRKEVVTICSKHKFCLIDPLNEDLFYSAFEKVGILPAEESDLLRKYRCITFETVKIILNKMKDNLNK